MSFVKPYRCDGTLIIDNWQVENCNAFMFNHADQVVVVMCRRCKKQHQVYYDAHLDKLVVRPVQSQRTKTKPTEAKHTMSIARRERPAVH